MRSKIKLFLQTIMLAIFVLLSISLLRSITKIVSSNQKIVDEQNKLTSLTQQNQKLQEQLSQEESQQFLEGQARDKLGLAKPGETVVVLPDEDISKTLAPKLDQENFTLPLPIYESWMKLFL